MKTTTTLAIMALLIALSAQDAQATWRQIDNHHLPRVHQKASTSNPPLWDKEAEAITHHGFTAGSGKAYAHSIVTSVTWTLKPKNGLKTSLWLHFPPGVGEVEVVAEGEIAAWAKAKGPGVGRAAAFGFVEATFWVNGSIHPLIVTATTAVTTTMVQGLPTFYLNLPIGSGNSSATAGINLPVVFRNGSGKVPDSQRDRRVHVHCPVSKFETREAASCSVFVWAMGSQTGAKGQSACDIEGTATLVFQLLTHAQCPQQP